MWNRLLDRIRADYPDFPSHAFNTLRDTSADLVLQYGMRQNGGNEIVGTELAVMQLTHKHVNRRDRNLRRYTNPSFEALFDALRQLERDLQAVFDAAPSDPFTPQPQAYTSLKTINRILALRQKGVSVSKIAKDVKKSTTTVYRHLDRAKKNGILR
jgi:DNA-binding transcriptional ArsR family regulator